MIKSVRSTARLGLLLGTLCLMLASRADAGFLATYAGQSGGGYNYTLDFTTDTNASTNSPVERLDPAGAANGVAGMVTIFDFATGTAASPPTVTLSGTALGKFTVTETLVGPAYPGATPITGDSPTLYNITFTYIGATTTMATSFSGINILTSLTGTSFGSTVGQDTRNIGGTAGTAVTNSANVLVPSAVPEPASIALLGLGGLAGLGMLRRSRIARA